MKSFSNYENKPFLVKVFVLQEILLFKKFEMKNTVNEKFLHENTIKANTFSVILWEAEIKVHKFSKNK